MISLKLDRPDLIRTGAYIGGQWITDGPTFKVQNPADGSVVAEVLDGGPELARQAADAAAEAFETWRKALPKTRSDLLRRWFDLVTRHAEDLARLMSLEQGKPLSESRAEIAYGAGYIEWFSEEARRNGGDVIPRNKDGREMFALTEPLGVAAVVTPWNFPNAMIARKMAPAIAAGCTVVGKPAADTPLSALALAALAEEAEFPPGLLNLVPAAHGNARGVVQAWQDDMRVRKLSFTGSTQTGRKLAEAAAPTLKRLSLELGGDAPFIVLDDADLDVALQALKAAKFRNGGQACTAANRVLVHRDVQDAFVARIEALIDGLKVGPATDPEAEIGPLIHQDAVAKVERLVGQAIEAGAQLRRGGRVHPQLGGTFYAPTLLTGVTAEMEISRTEVFGPVIALQTFADEAEAIRMANDTEYGLAAYLFSKDAGRCWRMTRALEFGVVGVNEGLVSTEVAPFGGVKQSGYGREGSIHGLSEYQSLKYVCFGGIGD
ncbi:NAD-dependent succinate-semialdehyde dehydrogenase [Brevundimonas sp. 2R-24]|uniref:NAD-dependent succinate-semialdehyde dehydrogenase n=1 Tax=Peiella sedimenti TaxID=3061083 RepID=A0ABT8SHP2_9CAUL|nr:NAD-dependent succinate-semialdehyde dehydrogenase [Caulobacteraceae bacterium XZ-24]